MNALHFMGYGVILMGLAASIAVVEVTDHILDIQKEDRDSYFKRAATAAIALLCCVAILLFCLGVGLGMIHDANLPRP